MIDEATGELVTIGTYPTNYGLAGKSFTEQRAVYGTINRDFDLFKKVDYMNENVKIRNYAAIPLCGYGGEIVGILELINRKQGEPTEKEIRELDPYKESIGLMIQHIQELDATLDVSPAIKKMLSQIKNIEAS